MLPVSVVVGSWHWSPTSSLRYQSNAKTYLDILQWWVVSMILFTCWLPVNNIRKWYNEILDSKQHFTQLCVTQFGLLCNLRSKAWQREGNGAFWPSAQLHDQLLDFRGVGVKGLLFHFILSKIQLQVRNRLRVSAYFVVFFFFSKIVALVNYTSARAKMLTRCHFSRG